MSKVLTQEGVNLAVEGYVEGMQTHPEAPPVERLLGQFADQGGRFFVVRVGGRQRDDLQLLTPEGGRRCA